MIIPKRATGVARALTLFATFVTMLITALLTVLITTRPVTAFITAQEAIPPALAAMADTERRSRAPPG